MAINLDLDDNYEEGTIVSATSDADYDATICDNVSIPLGVVNADGEVETSGKVNIKCGKRVYAGKELYMMDNGICSVYSFSTPEDRKYLVGIALEDNDTKETKLVKCLLRL